MSFLFYNSGIVLLFLHWLICRWLWRNCQRQELVSLIRRSILCRQILQLASFISSSAREFISALKMLSSSLWIMWFLQPARQWELCIRYMSGSTVDYIVWSLLACYYCYRPWYICCNKPCLCSAAICPKLTCASAISYCNLPYKQFCVYS